MIPPSLVKSWLVRCFSLRRYTSCERAPLHSGAFFVQIAILSASVAGTRASVVDLLDGNVSIVLLVALLLLPSIPLLWPFDGVDLFVVVIVKVCMIKYGIRKWVMLLILQAGYD